MYVSLRLGLFVRLLVLTAVLTAMVLLALNARTDSPAVQPSPPSSPAEPAQAAPEREPVPYRVWHTGGTGLNLRACPGTVCARAGLLHDGQTFAAECLLPGAAVAGERRWLRGTVDGTTVYASARYLRTATGTIAAACDVPAAAAG
ncbi:hypothetical protein [Prauserella muralis]|uniref:Uncharacterized protein n=1 Tax=Prauserella muralis TaxID=588067 RepID=A0A2V4B9Y5_9PSEU|nr:hypothetical protein [Prauserella muralis]PXY31936.1 hypothetical protein BAY60_06315 [Prauserella muralis]TWE13639.1 hypothetical protein FHX69_5763 [Prauserella muralis]